MYDENLICGKVTVSWNYNLLADIILRKHSAIRIFIRFLSQPLILIFLMKAVRNMILNFVLSAFFSITEPISALLPICQRKNFLWKKSKSYIE
jgi:hypothetical protein